MEKAIVIPIYKESLTPEEIISLKQCYKVLNKHKIFFAAPTNLDIIPYKAIIGNIINIERFEDKYFESISGYNSLMLSSEFYKRFKNNEYILIYQLDCHVFKDELDFWCDQGYDFIGSPWLDYKYYNLNNYQKLFFQLKMKISTIISPTKISKERLTNQVGNGGFSLRNTKVFYNVCLQHNSNKLQKFKDSNDSAGMYNEDVYWSFFAKNIKKPSYKKALKFSIDNGVSIGLNFNNGKVPFGCH